MAFYGIRKRKLQLAGAGIGTRPARIGGRGRVEKGQKLLPHLAQQLGIEAVADGETINFTAYQVQRLQLLQVLRHGGAR